MFAAIALALFGPTQAERKTAHEAARRACQLRDIRNATR